MFRASLDKIAGSVDWVDYQSVLRTRQFSAQPRIGEHRLLPDHQSVRIDPAQFGCEEDLGLSVRDGDQIIRRCLRLHIRLFQRPEPGIDDLFGGLLDQLEDGCGVHGVTLSKVEVILRDEIDQQFHALV